MFFFEFFIPRTSYWASEKQWSDARAFMKRSVFIVTPHHEMISKRKRVGVYAISPVVSSKDLRKYLLDGISGKLFDVNDDSLES